ncbi:hypothetical protein K180097E11_19710 [Phocaeicola dorei]
MEQTKNEPTKENKAAPDTGKPKKGREPLTEAQRLKRQKMIVLPAMVLVFNWGDVADIRPVLRQGTTAGNGRIQHRNARR